MFKSHIQKIARARSEIVVSRILSYLKQSKKKSSISVPARATWQNKNISIVTKISNGLLVKGNDKALTELFIILPDNAVKYSPSQTKVRLRVIKPTGMSWLM